MGQDGPRVGIASFTLRGLSPSLVAAALAAEHAIGVRAGKFCAHPAVRRLTGGGDAVRASIGIATTHEHITRLTSALHQLAADGPHLTCFPVLCPTGLWLRACADRKRLRASF